MSSAIEEILFDRHDDQLVGRFILARFEPRECDAVELDDRRKFDGHLIERHCGAIRLDDYQRLAEPRLQELRVESSLFQDLQQRTGPLADILDAYGYAQRRPSDLARPLAEAGDGIAPVTCKWHRRDIPIGHLAEEPGEVV